MFEIEFYFFFFEGSVTKLSAPNIQCLKFETGIATFFAAVSHNIERLLSYSNEHLLPSDVTHVQGLLLSHLPRI